MLYFASVFFLIAILAAAAGIGGISVCAAGIAKVLFVLGSAARCDRNIDRRFLPL